MTEHFELEQLFGKVIDVQVDRIVPDPENLRDVFDQDDIADLGRNMQEVGQMDEILVFPVLEDDGGWSGKFDLHDGERRWRAAREVGIKELRAKVEPRPTNEELLYKKLSRVLQTRTLDPESKVAAVEVALRRLDLLDKPDQWESYRSRFGGGQEWPQIVRVLKLAPRVRELMGDGVINFTLGQSIGRLPQDRQEEAARFVVANKINGRYFSTQIVPFLLENPNATMAQAFEHTKVGDWRQYIRSPYQKGQEPPVSEQLERFLQACVSWERAWETVVHTGLVHELEGSAAYEHRMKDAARRIAERAVALMQRVDRPPPHEQKAPRELREGSVRDLPRPLD